ncbi:RagB/SusD family nutrient uptake outer membrane protein [Pontibacter locisalis]|uniref:RagB/SusD family nutrient uptake outer membrane protein n=1 Tax=Pontibacter locisalis TaxID=1719035 RepID=A0ABW5ILB4_9BACT
MNNILKTSARIAFVAAMALGTASCDDFLDLQPKDARVESNFYKTEADAMEALVSIYDVLQWNTVTGFHPTPMLMDIASDDAFAGGASRTDAPNIIEVDMHNIRTSNPEIQGLWKKHFIGIYRANLLLEKIEGVEASQEVKDRIIAETKFLRAHFYLDLVRTFENVPLVLNTLVNPDEYNQPQAAPKAVYNQIAKDLEEAIAKLPESTLRANQGRVTKWAAKALLARTYLFYNGVYGEQLQAGDVTVDAQRALNHLKDIINNSGHALLGNYADNFKKSGEYSQESVWEIAYSDLNPWYDWGYIQGGEGNIQPQMQGPRVVSPAIENYERGWSFAPATQSLYDAFEANDPRRDATLLIETELNGELDKGYQHTGYFSQKYTTSKDYKPGAGQLELNWGNNYRSVRYSDVLLMAAELSVKAGGGDAKQYLDMVRSRVGLPLVPATLDNILKERRVELALEGQRYWDLLRQGVTVADQKITVNGKRGPLYTGDQVDFNVTFKPATKGFFPIPQSEIAISNGLLKQNAGY